MKKSSFFESLSLRNRLRTHTAGFQSLFSGCLSEVFGSQFPLQLLGEFCLTELVYILHHFGFAGFAPQARFLLVDHINANSGLGKSLLTQWLDQCCYAAVEEYNILKIFQGEPDWSYWDTRFFVELSRRILCCDSEADLHDLGLSTWNRPLINEFLYIGTAPHTVSSSLGASLGVDCQLLERCWNQAVEDVRDNPMRLLAWRLTYFCHLQKSTLQAPVAFRQDDLICEQKAYELAALLSLLWPYKSNGPKEQLFLVDPVPVTSIIRFLEATGFEDMALPYAEARVLAHKWLNHAITTEGIRGTLARLISLGVEVDVFYTVPYRRNSKSIGLTKRGNRIFAPYASVFEKLFFNNPGVVAVLGASSNDIKNSDLLTI